MNDLKVYGAGMFGMAATSLDWITPVLDVGVRLGQLGVAVVTILYIYSKWKAVRASKKRRK